MLKEKVINKLYDFVVYGDWSKKIAFTILRTPQVVENPIYNFFYMREMKNKMQKYSEVPFRVTIENTNACKSNCTFCPHDKMKRKIGIMEQALFEKIIDDCVSLNINYVSVYWFGEPLSDPLFPDRVEYAKSSGIKRVTTNTNLYFLNKKKAKAIIDAELDEIYVSLDAVTEETYKKLRPGLNFNTVENNIKTLLKVKENKNVEFPKVFLSYVENSLNNHETKLFISKWKSLVDGISISQIHNWAGNIAHENSTKSYRKKEPCRLLWMDMVISWDGKVPLCCLDYENRVVLGDLRNNTIRDVWSGKIIKEIRDNHIRGRYEKLPLCKNCEYNFHDKTPWWISK